MIQRFDVKLKDGARVIPVGTVKVRGSRLTVSPALQEHFPVKTKRRADLLKACRWCLHGSAGLTASLDMELRKVTYQIVPVRDPVQV